jgi:energy-coupling factor transporter transmembrane protein EcfT
VEHFWSIFFLIGLLVVMAYAWQRFNEPSFPQRETLPRTVDPLRYLFLRSTYGKARWAYVAGLIVLYALFVAPGPTMIEALGDVGFKDFPPKAWALLVALVLTGVGVAPASVKWLNILEEWLRRWVHAWFLVPDGIERTIGVLEDARYDPPPSQLSLVESPATRERLQENLKAPTGTLRYRWARAGVLMVSLRQMGAGATHPLKRAAFEPFEEDFKAILASYRALRPDVEAVLNNPTGSDSEENLLTSVDNLLKRLYAYISWGLLQQADREGDIDQTLEELGFRIPKTGGRRLLDIVAPAALLVALITFVFWLTMDAGRWAMGKGADVSDTVIGALSPAIAALLMYGSAVFIALKGRAAQIEEKTWREGSPRCLIPIAIKAGLVTWAVIIAATVVSDQFPQVWRSLSAMVHALKSFIAGAAVDSAVEGWSFLPIRIATALPWVLVGATASAVLASSLGGDVRRIERSQRVREAIILGIAVGLAAGASQSIQFALMEKLEDASPPYGDVLLIALAAFACGAVIGFKVPVACRINLMTPLDPIMARALRDLLAQAKVALGSETAARDWVFTPNGDLDGITPAEAVQYKTQATGVGRLLEAEAVRRREEVRGERPTPVVIEGGRSAGGLPGFGRAGVGG